MTCDLSSSPLSRHALLLGSHRSLSTWSSVRMTTMRRQKCAHPHLHQHPSPAGVTLQSPSKPSPPPFPRLAVALRPPPSPRLPPQPPRLPPPPPLQCPVRDANASARHRPPHPPAPLVPLPLSHLPRRRRTPPRSNRSPVRSMAAQRRWRASGGGRTTL